MSKKYSNQSYFESEPSDGKAGIAVQNLQKVFKSLTGSPIQAVSDSFQLGRPGNLNSEFLGRFCLIQSLRRPNHGLAWS